jgi:hypothetical protein
MDELSPSARTLLRAADASDEPSADDAKRVRRAVLLRVGAVGGGTTTLAANAAQAKGLLGSLGAKLGAALLVVAGASSVTYLAVRPRGEPPRAVVSATHVSVAPREVASPALPAPLDPVLAPQPENLSPAPSFEDRRASRSSKEDEARREGRAKRIDPEPAAPLEAEMKLIRSADAALRAGRTSEALSLLAAHAKEHPKGLLAQERRGLEILARCQSSPGARAQNAAKGFLSSAPRSPLSPRIRSACGVEK